MIKVENNMLILDSTFSKQDAAAINEFINIAKKEERERIIKIIEKRRDYYCSSALCKAHGLVCMYCKADNDLIDLIKGEQK